MLHLHALLPPDIHREGKSGQSAMKPGDFYGQLGNPSSIYGYIAGMLQKGEVETGYATGIKLECDLHSD